MDGTNSQETVQNYPIAAQNGAVSQTVAPAVAFDGSQSGILIAQALAPSIPAEFTISAWVYSYYGQYPQIIFSSGDPASDPNTVQLAYNLTEDSNISILCTAGQQTVAHDIRVAGVREKRKNHRRMHIEQACGHHHFRYLA